MQLKETSRNFGSSVHILSCATALEQLLPVCCLHYSAHACVFIRVWVCECVHTGAAVHSNQRDLTLSAAAVGPPPQPTQQSPSRYPLIPRGCAAIWTSHCYQSVCHCVCVWDYLDVSERRWCGSDACCVNRTSRTEAGTGASGKGELTASG